MAGLLVPAATCLQVSEQMRLRAGPLRADLERVQAFQRDELRDMVGLPVWVREAIEAGAVDLHNVVQNLKLIPL